MVIFGINPNLIMKSFFCAIYLLLYFSIAFGQKENHNTDIKVSELIKLSNDARKINRTMALSYIQEALKLEREVSDTTRRKLYRLAGVVYKENESHYMELSFFLKELEIQNKLNPSESFFILNNIGGSYYNLGNLKKARDFWERAKNEYEIYSNKNKTNPKNIEGSLIYNNLAVLESEEGNYAKALEMLKEFKLRNEQLKDTLNIIIAYENMAETYLKLNDISTALTHLWKGIALARAIKSEYDLASLYTMTGGVYSGSNDERDSALYYLNLAFELSGQHNFTDINLSSSEKLVNLYKDDNPSMALKYLLNAKSLSEQNIRKENEKKVSGLEYEFSEKMKQNEVIQNQKRRESYLISGMVLLALFSTIVFLMFKLQKNKSQKRTIENELLAKQLEEKNRELTNTAIQIIQRDEIIDSTHKELKELKGRSDVSSNKLLTKIISDLRTGRQAFNNAEFEKLFMETDGDFYKRLLATFPALTKNEIRLCAFLRLNLSSKEISSITKQTPNSIVVARSRLRKKLDLDENQSLTNFLVRF